MTVNAPAGTWNVLISIDDEDSVPEGDDTNNILAAGTIRAENVADLIATTGTSQVHFRAPRNVHPQESGQSLSTQDSGGHEVTDADLVRAVREALN